MEVAVAVEQRRPVRETPAERLGRELASFAAAILRMTALAALLAPVLLFSFLTVDMPVRRFDQQFDMEALKPSYWLSVGGLIIALGAPLTILFARRFGGDEASRAITAAWGLAAVASFAELSYLAPTLDAADFPSVRFVVAFVASAMIGEYVAVGVYDVVRGAGQWWRAPILAALIGFAAHSLVYFPTAYWTSSAPWFSWMVADYAVKAVIAFAFLPIYWVLQKPLRPVGGYGGRRIR
ncbi:MAG: VUT family protein [Amphiplicatus sp.]